VQSEFCNHNESCVRMIKRHCGQKKCATLVIDLAISKITALHLIKCDNHLQSCWTVSLFMHLPESGALRLVMISFISH